MIKLLRIQLSDESDMVHCRQRARQTAALLHLDALQQTQVATAVSELARNALKHAGGGRVTFSLNNEVPLSFWVKVEDKGPGIKNIDTVLASTQGIGLRSCFRLMDECQIESAPGLGTTVVVSKALPKRMPYSQEEIGRHITTLLAIRPQDAMAEFRSQNKELLASLEELKREQEISHGYQRQLEELNKELADTNRGVIALNSELEDQAKTVREASDMKARFLSHITHEFRTPVNSILSMSRILQTAESLTDDQEKQVNFMRSAAEYLSEMVNDLLDTVKADSGKWEVTAAPVKLTEVFDTLRALFRPLLAADRPVQLRFDGDDKVPVFFSDETKISQIVRNFISNSLKFTEVGSIDVSASIRDPHTLVIAVRDTGIGIAPENQGKIFEEFVQVQGPLQHRAKGTGLGLPLARKLAHLIDGEVAVESEFGLGSTFLLRLPLLAADLNAPSTYGND